MKLVDQVVSSFAVSKMFCSSAGKIKNIDFSLDGEFFISSDEEEILVYDCNEGSLWKRIFSKKYGVHLTRFTKNKYYALHTSRKIDNSVRYLSILDYKYIRYFSGHTRKVISLSVNPVEETFVSTSLDKSARIWDLRTPNCLTVLQTGPLPVTAYDPEGLVLALGVDSKWLRLYDLRFLEKGPFCGFEIQKEMDCEWTGVKFSPDGKKIILTTDGSFAHIFDTCTSEPVISVARYTNAKQIPIDASFSPDSQFLFTGSSNGMVHIWNVVSGLKVCALDSNHSGPVQYVQFCPRYMMLASAYRNTTEFWVPKYCEDINEGEEAYSPEDEVEDLGKRGDEDEDMDDELEPLENTSFALGNKQEAGDDGLSAMRELNGSKSI